MIKREFCQVVLKDLLETKGLRASNLVVLLRCKLKYSNKFNYIIATPTSTPKMHPETTSKK